MGTNSTEADGPSTTEVDPAGADEIATDTGLEPNVAGALSYLLGIITGLVFYVVEPDDKFVRFHAAQSIVTFGILIGVWVVFSIVSTMLSLVFLSGGAGGFLVGGFLSLLLGLVWLVFAVGTFGLWLFLMLRAYQGKTPRVPVAAGIADKLV